MRISPRLRAALAAKGTLLAALALTFVALLYRGALTDDHAWWARALSGIVFAPLAAFVGQTAWLAFADAVTGKAITIHGAIALASRRAGYSLRLPDGHFAEFILFNPWPSLTAHRHYTVTIGSRSRVVVAPPELEPEPTAVPSPATSAP